MTLLALASLNAALDWGLRGAEAQYYHTYHTWSYDTYPNEGLFVYIRLYYSIHSIQEN